MLVRLNLKKACRVKFRNGPGFIELNKDNPTAEVMPGSTSAEGMLTVKRMLADGKLELVEPEEDEILAAYIWIVERVKLTNAEANLSAPMLHEGVVYFPATYQVEEIVRHYRNAQGKILPQPNQPDKQEYKRLISYIWNYIYAMNEGQNKVLASILEFIENIDGVDDHMKFGDKIRNELERTKRESTTDE